MASSRMHLGVTANHIGAPRAQVVTSVLPALLAVSHSRYGKIFRDGASGAACAILRSAPSLGALGVLLSADGVDHPKHPQ